MLRRYGVGAVLLLGVLSLPVQAQEQLAWKFKEGDKFWLETVSTSRQTMKTLGKELKQDLEQATVFSITVQKVNADNSAVLEEKIEALGVKNLGTPSGVSGTEDKLHQQMKDATFRITVTPRGDITKFEGYEELVRKIAGGDENAQKTLRAVLSEESLRTASAQVMGLLPAGPVKVGDKWGEDRKLETMLGPVGSLTVTRQYTYDGKETVEGKSLDRISFTGTATYTAPKSSEGSPFPFQVAKSDLKADDIKGTLYFDAAAGRLVRSETSLRLHGTVTITTGGTTLDTELVEDQAVSSRVYDKPPPAPK